MTQQKATGNYTLVAIDRVEPNPDQPRKHFDVAALETLAASISENGLLQPITVTHRGGGRYQIIAGERRWRAAQIAGLTEIAAIVRGRMAEADVYRLSVLENVARADMNIIEEARAYAQLRDSGSTVAEIARSLGVDEKMISQRLSLLNLRDDYRDLAASGQLPRVRAYNISRLSHNGQAAVMQKLVAGEIDTEKQVKLLCDAIRGREQQPTLVEPTDADTRYQAGRMQRKLAQASWEKIEALGPAMAAFLELDPTDLADALGSDLDLYQDRIDSLTKTASAMRHKLEQAQALRDAQATF